jgi:HD-like signal output (HDOD) protein
VGSIHEWELKHFSVDHYIAAEILLRYWRFPDELIDAISVDPYKEKDEVSHLEKIILLSEQITNQTEFRIDIELNKLNTYQGYEISDELKGKLIQEATEEFNKKYKQI